jgi:23S rRNA pseudouridine1911/1915/1917 synthase
MSEARIQTNHPRRSKKSSSSLRTKSHFDLPLPRIVFEDNSLLVIDKPSGWVVNRAKSVKSPTVQDWVEDYFGSQNSMLSEVEASDSKFPLDFINRSGIVHRLDKDTSGLLIIAKTPDAFTNLQAQFKHRQVKKTYLALVHGRVEPEQGTISVPVGRQTFNRHRFGIIPGGRPSVTKYQVVSYPSQASSRVGPSKTGGSNPARDATTFTLLKLHPQTGRTHQLRVHLKYIGHPIVSDPLYLGRKTLKKDLRWCPRLFLHAAQLSFSHPIDNRQLSLTCDLPEELQKLIS